MHGYAIKRASVYRSWEAMKRRCLSAKDHAFKDYGGRGIKVCDRWNSFVNFLSDMGEGKKGWQLERVNNNGNYEPENCVWALPKHQNRNRRNNRLIRINGADVPLGAVAEKIGMPYQTLWVRIVRNKWPVEKAISTPSQRALSRTTLKSFKLYA